MAEDTWSRLEAGGSIDLGWDRIAAAAPGLSGAGIATAFVLMLAGLAPEESLALQWHGLGEERMLGCGLFIPHKGIGDLRARSE